MSKVRQSAPYEALFGSISNLARKRESDLCLPSGTWESLTRAASFVFSLGRWKHGSAAASLLRHRASPNPPEPPPNSPSPVEPLFRTDIQWGYPPNHAKQMFRKFRLQIPEKVVFCFCVCCSCIAFGFVKRSQGQTCGLFLRPKAAVTLKRGSEFEAPNSSI